jgi:hypothetical protein
MLIEEKINRELISALETLDIPSYKLNVNEKGAIIIDENSPEDLIDWAVNG